MFGVGRSCSLHFCVPIPLKGRSQGTALVMWRKSLWDMSGVEVPNVPWEAQTESPLESHSQSSDEEQHTLQGAWNCHVESQMGLTLCVMLKSGCMLEASSLLQLLLKGAMGQQSSGKKDMKSIRSIFAPRPPGPLLFPLRYLWRRWPSGGELVHGEHYGVIL